MNVKPIIFSTPMVRALLEGRKTQTRRIIKPQPTLAPEERMGSVVVPPALLWDRRNGRPGNGANLFLDFIREFECPYGASGDLLWVRESWADVGGDPWYMADGRERSYSACDTFEGGGYPPVCRDIGANCCSVTRQKVRWSPSIHMPRWASRQTLRITDVRVQRLQEISEADAKAEGAEPYSVDGFTADELALLDAPLLERGNPYRNGFALLWDSINGPGAWERNEWVWALSFEVIRANVDQVLQGRAA